MQLGEGGGEVAGSKQFYLISQVSFQIASEKCREELKSECKCVCARARVCTCMTEGGWRQKERNTQKKQERHKARTGT